MGMSFFKQLRREFAGYNGKKLSQDLMAGLTVAAVALPLALALGVSAGATAACGLVTAIVAGLVISALTGGYYQISGPTGAMAAILGSLIGTYGMQGMFVATFLAGIMQSDRVRTGAGHYRLYIGHRGHHRARPDRQLFRHAF